MRKENLNILVAICVFMMTLSVPAMGRSIYVDPNGSADFTRIQAAINDANDGDEIEVAPGTYNEAIDFNGKAVRLYSSGGPEVTTIDGQSFQDDFNDGNYAGWQIVDQGNYSTPSSWSAATGEMVQSSNIYTEPTSDQRFLGTYALCTHEMPWGDYEVTLSIKSLDDDWMGVMFRYVDQNNYYRFAWNGTIADRRLVKMESGAVTTLEQDGSTYVGDQWYQVRIAVRGENLKVFVDDVKVFDVNDNSFSAGAIALYCWGNSGTYFDNIEVKWPAYHVVQCVSGEGPDTILEGFTITGGNANGTSPDNCGGGMYNSNSDPNVKNCIFTGNEADSFGGGMYNSNANPTVTNCTFGSNTAAVNGGAIANYSNSNPSIKDCIFENNVATNYGGGVYNHDSDPAVMNCIFHRNEAQLGKGGAIANYDGSNSTITNCTFSNNSATNDVGGGIRNYNCSPTVTNCILWDNVPDEISSQASALVVSFCDIKGGHIGSGNIDADPFFVDAAVGDLRLRSSSSPCVDTGTNGAPGLTTTDLAGNPRIVDGDRNGTATVDMGAYELQAVPVHNITQDLWYEIIQVSIDDANDGDQIEVGPGTYNEAINFNGKAIRLYSTAGPNDTTIDGTGNYHVVQCVSGEDANTILEGFTITGGNANGAGANDMRGGGMYNNGSSPIVTDCTFSGNEAGISGGGMYCESSNPTVNNCIFSGNEAGLRGGGMDNSFNSSPRVTNCTFTNNTTTGSGGGMGNWGGSPTVTDCNFSGNSAELGGGMFNYGGSQTVTNCVFIGNTARLGSGMHNESSSARVRNCTFTNNTASELGGGMNNGSGSPTVTNCTFSGNSATSSGGGMANFGGSQTVIDCTFTGNTSNLPGGGMYNYYGSQTITGCAFTGNSATGYGGGMSNNSSSPTVTDCNFTGNMADYGGGGGMWNNNSSPIVTNCTFSGNSANIGGGMFNRGGSRPTVNNCTFFSNTAISGGGMYNRGTSNPTVANCILWDDTLDEVVNVSGGAATVTYSDVQGGWPGEGNINISPLFVDAGAGDFRLRWYSPCVDSGDNNAPGLPATDLAGNNRVIDGDGDGTAVADMGVYELEAGLFKVGVGTLSVTIEPNEAVIAGAMWKIEDQNDWYSSGDVIDLAPGYHKVEFTELTDWFEPRTVEVGYDPNDPNSVAERSLRVRVIGDMTASVRAEYKPLPVYDIGQIPPEQAPHGSMLEFFVDANWLGEDLLFSLTTTFDANYPEPEGPILIDPNSGRFTYEPDDVNDRVAFDVTFRAEFDVDANEQTIQITTLPDLMPEYEIVSRPVQNLPDPRSQDYIFVNEILSDSNGYLNGEYKTVRSVTVSGIEITIEDVFDNPVYVYNGNLDINDLTICVETLIIRNSLRLPQTDVTIYARDVYFEDGNGVVTDINTTPVDLRSIPADQETDGLAAGDISLFIEAYDADRGLSSRFVMNGTKGYYGGSYGQAGELTCTLDSSEPLGWLSPYALKMLIAYAKDAYLYGYTLETREILQEYDDLLGTYKEQPEWQNVFENWQFEFEQMRQEIITLLHRLDNDLDYFGNPPDWVPALSFEVLKTVYDQEIDHAIRVLYLSYWLENKANDISAKAAGLSNYRDKLWNQTMQFKQDYYTYNDLISPLEVRAAAIAAQIGRAGAGGCSGLLCELKQKEAALLELANTRVEKLRDVPWWKKAVKTLATVATYTFLGATKKGGKTGAALGASGGLMVAAKDLFLGPEPWEAATSLTDVAEKFNGINFEQATDRWMGQFEDIELADIETNGANGYLQNLRASSYQMADGLWEVKETLKTTKLDDDEVDKELKRIKASDPTFNKLVDRVTALKVEKQVFSQQLAAAMQKVSTLSNSMTNNVLAIDAMNRDASHLNRILNPRVLMYLRDMERRALARLRKYHYYMAKAYEYRLLEPYPGDLNVDDMFTEMTSLGESTDGTLSQADFDALKAVYEEQLSTLAEHILDEFFLGGNVEKNVSTPYMLFEEEISQLNAGEPLTINLFERGLFPSDRENIRIVNMSVKDNINVVVTGDCGSFGNVVVTMYHPSISKLQWKDNVYVFRHLAQDTKELLDIEWVSEYDTFGDQLYHTGVSASSESLLWSLLSDADKNHAMIYSRPGAWADIVITKTENKDQDCGMDIAEMTLIIEYDYYDKEDDLQTLRIATEPKDLAPYFLVDLADANNRRDGAGNFYRIYDWYLTPDVNVTAPQMYGQWRFEEWTDRFGYTLGYDTTLEVSFSPDSYFRDDQTVYAQYVYEGPVLSIADFDEDYDVDFEDYSALSRVWKTEPADPEWDPVYDISDPPDDYIDWRDVAVLCENWLAGTEPEL